MPPNLFTSTIPRIREITAANSAAYAGWPNGKSSKQPPKNRSLLGAHRIISNIGPDIAFTLAQAYMPALTAPAPHPGDGSLLLRWTAVQAVSGYAVWAFGGMDSGGAVCSAACRGNRCKG